MLNSNEEKDLLKQETQLSLLQALNYIIKPSLDCIDIDIYNKIINNCFAPNIISLIDKQYEQSKEEYNKVIKDELSSKNLLISNLIESKIMEFKN